MEAARVMPPNHGRCDDKRCPCHNLDVPVYDFDNPPKDDSPQQESFIPASHRKHPFYAILRAVLPSLILLSSLLKIRQVVIDEIRKVIDCGNSEKGGTLLMCPCCGGTKFVPFTCKSRFCPSCGNLYNMQRLVGEATVLLDVSHFHITFTIDERLRRWFLANRLSLDDLFDAARETLLDYYAGSRQDLKNRTEVKKRFKTKGKKKRKQKQNRILTPGLVLVLHTFGRDLKWNPHLHVLCTRGALDSNAVWHEFSYISYEYLHIVFMHKLIAKLRKRFGGNKAFHKLSCEILRDHPQGFHVHVDNVTKDDASSGENPLKRTIKYIGRYLGRPPIAMSRIDKFDEETHMVTFHYLPHEPHEELNPGEPMFETLHMLCFALRLIRHIPDRQFKMIRYAGLYSSTAQRSHLAKWLKAHLLYKFKSREKQILLSHWRGAYMRSFHTDPVICPECKVLMEKLYVRVGNKKYWVREAYPRIPWQNYIKQPIKIA
jgi:hypothetical protein